jgi:N-acetylneuraminate synthase
MNLIEIFNAPPQSYTSIFVIAEAGINHNGDIQIAKQMIETAKEVGCNAIKFQKRKIDLVYTPEFLAEKRDSPWGTTQYDQKFGLEFSDLDFIELKNLAEEIGIAFSASAWDLISLEFIESLKPIFHKVASAFITNIPFLQKVASYGRPTLVSTGMCNLDDIDRAVEIFRKANCPFMLMHSVSIYPAKNSELNLLMLKSLSLRYSVSVGYSGHESSVSPTITAAALGAKVIERHFTLDRSMYGSDQSASLEPDGMRKLVSSLSKYPDIIGDGVKRFPENEQIVAKKLRYWN